MSSAVLQVGNDARFERFESIEWWNQDLLRQSKILLIGAGAIGNEVLKNLALLGLGSIAVVDIDRIELSNLTRSVLFRAEDRGKFKAECAARAAKEIYPDLNIVPLTGNILSELGLGVFLWADVILAAVDNREARLFINSVCAKLGKTWFDGGIEVLNGIARGFSPPVTACYECLMSERDWEVVNQRRSCSLLAARAEQHHGVPTTPTTASVIGAIEAQETVKFLHGMEFLSGSGFVFEGTSHSSYRVRYSISPDCPWHEEVVEILPMASWTSETPMREIWEYAIGQLDGLDALDLSRELVETLECRACNKESAVFSPPERIPSGQIACEACGTSRSPRFLHSIIDRAELLCRTVGEIGLPKRDVIWARKGDLIKGFEIAGDPLFEKEPE